jgi:hypothetical protein
LVFRFQYDPLTDTNVKVNDKFEFPEKLDLTSFQEVARDRQLQRQASQQGGMGDWGGSQWRITN